ncbi:hypothetical protein DSO57_1034204 [Entomophthora muscae]|uniref:Uncharacterized protein n=1 Tax=Entomophthora muscae TaxID=34485 RepID=A0ACC2S246_9FUNG|nr:hypothetical protein DSO57_1034204 [Entomophthora muscae]
MMISMLSPGMARKDYITIRLPGKPPQQLNITEGRLIDMPKAKTSQAPKDKSEENLGPSSHTLFTNDQTPEETDAGQDESSNLAGHIYLLQMISEPQPPKKLKKKGQKSKPASERAISPTRPSNLGQQTNSSLIKYSVQTNSKDPISIQLNQRFLSEAPIPPPKLVVERGFISLATYHPCPVECRPVSFGPEVDDPLLPIIFPFLYYNTGRTFASYDRDFLPWADPTKIRICTPKLVALEPVLESSSKKPSKSNKKGKSGKRHNRK